jgi:uncharacterized protein YycO
MHKILFIFYLLTSCITQEATTYDFNTGDIIFHTSKSSQSQAIQAITNSKYSHVGVIYKLNGELYVFEAIQPVSLTPLRTFISRGKGKKFTVKRLKNTSIINNNNFSDAYVYARKQVGKNYDSKFLWSDDRMYCSELVWKIYKQIGIEVGEIQTFSSFNFSSPEVTQIVRKRFPDGLPMNELVVTPISIANSNLLYTVYTNY